MSQDNSNVKITLTLKHKKTLADRSCVQFYNVLFRRIMQTLKMVQMNKNFYDPTVAMMVPQVSFCLFLAFLPPPSLPAQAGDLARLRDCSP